MGRETRGELMARVLPLAGENQVAFSHMPRGAEGTQPSDLHPPGWTRKRPACHPAAAHGHQL